MKESVKNFSAKFTKLECEKCKRLFNIRLKTLPNLNDCLNVEY